MYRINRLCSVCGVVRSSEWVLLSMDQVFVTCLFCISSVTFKPSAVEAVRFYNSSKRRRDLTEFGG